MQLTFSESELLYHRIKRMISAGGKLEDEQVFRMFSLYGRPTVASHINALLGTSGIMRDPETRLLTSPTACMRTEIEQQKISLAFWILAEIGDEDILQYEVVSEPTQLLWMRKEDQKLFDATVIPESAVQPTILLWNKLRKGKLLDNEEDPVDHIAFVKDDKTGAYAVQTGGFDRYCLLDANKNVVFRPSIKPPEPNSADATNVNSGTRLL